MCRPCSAHDAIRTLDQIVHRGEVSWILEADIVSFFDSLDRTKLKEMLEVRVADGSLLRLIGKCLHVGVLDGAELSAPETGTAQFEFGGRGGGASASQAPGRRLVPRVATFLPEAERGLPEGTPREIRRVNPTSAVAERRLSRKSSIDDIPYCQRSLTSI